MDEPIIITEDPEFGDVEREVFPVTGHDMSILLGLLPAIADASGCQGCERQGDAR